MTHMFKKLGTFFLFINFVFTFAAAPLLLGSSKAYAQNYTTSRLKCPDYVFSRDMRQGSVGADVRLLQEILNADYRTQISPVGKPGSPGQETTSYQLATREAVKRFQALFIELIGIADGKINAKTRVVLNSVCQGPYFTGGGGGIYDGVSTSTTATTTTTTTTVKDTVAPIITLSAPNTGYTGESYRLYVYGNEPIKYPSASSFIIDGGAVLSDIRKESPSVYKVLVTPSKTTAHTIKIQMEADAMVDLAGNKSQYASNEVSTVVSPAPAGPDVTAPGIILSAPFYLTVGDSYRMSIAGLENISAPNISDFIVTGGISFSDLQKVDDKNYSVLVSTVNTGPYTATVQLPAGKVKDLAGNGNTASNLLTITVLNKITVATGTVTTTTGGTDTSTYNPYTGGSGSDSGSGSGSGMDPMQMLMMGFMGLQAIKSLTGLLGDKAVTGATTQSGGGASSGGGTQIGGDVGVESACACMPARKTIQFTPRGLGQAGWYFKDKNPTVQPSCHVTGFALMIPAGPQNPCGMAKSPYQPSKWNPTGCAQLPGSIRMTTNPSLCCLREEANEFGQMVIGEFPPPSPVFRGCGI